MKLKIVTVIFFGAMEFCVRFNFSHDGGIPDVRIIDFPDDFFRNAFLCFIVVKNSGTILRTGVVTLPVYCGGIMNREKDF